MKTQVLSLALAAIAIASCTAANAQCCSGVNGVTQSNVTTYPAVIQGSAPISNYATIFGASDSSALNCAPLFGKHTFYDQGGSMRSAYGGSRRGGLLSMLGYGASAGRGMLGGLFGYRGSRNSDIGYGGSSYVGSSYVGSGYGPTTVNTFSAVLPTAYGGVTSSRICGQRLSNSMLDLRLFGFGFGLGKVNPRMDMRAAGTAF